jgi:hypothetical protein
LIDFGHDRTYQSLPLLEEPCPLWCNRQRQRRCPPPWTPQ